MVKIFAESDNYQLESVSQNEDTFDTLGASRYSFFSPAILQKFLSISLQKNKTLTPFCNTVYATVLFADISGFTRLSSHINVESLKKHINQFFTSLLGVVKEFNGDVIKFCGDAVMIMWPVSASETHGVKAATAYLAASCAMKLISDCGTYSKQEKGYKVLLRLHCGIGSGLVHCMCLGERDRWEFLISGDPLRQVGIAESEAGIGEVCMSEESYALVSDRFESIEMPEGSRNLVLSKPLKKVRGTTNNESMHSIQENLSIPLEIDLLNKLTNEQSRLNVISSADEQDGKPSIIIPERKSLDSSSPNSPIGGNLESKFDQSPLLHRPSQAMMMTMTMSSSSPATAAAIAAAESKRQSDDKDSSSTPSVHEKSPSQTPTPKRQNFFSPIFLHSPLLPTIDLSLDRDLKKNIATAKSYLGEFLCSGYIPPWNIVPYLHKFLMAPAKMAIENDTLNYVAELREVVTIFIEILGLEDDFNMGFVRRPQRVITIVIECLDRYLGSLRQYVVDDKGCVVIAAFGLPGSSHEDNSVRAIEAATAIRDCFMEVKIDCRIGIAKGMVYCGLVGSDDRCEYAMMGSSVNLAARLMSKGESGNILVNQDVQIVTEKVFKFTALQKIKAKGYAKPVAVFLPYERIQTHELSGHKSRFDSLETNTVIDSPVKDSKSTPKSSKKPQFIGRENELATFKKSLEIFVASYEEAKEMDSSRRRTTTQRLFQTSGGGGGGGGGGSSSKGGGGGEGGGGNISGRSSNGNWIGNGNDNLPSSRKVHSSSSASSSSPPPPTVTGSHQAHIIEGAAGAGKTWFIQEIIRIAKKINHISQIYICASTGQTQKSSQYYIIGQLFEQIFGISILNSLTKGVENRTPKMSSSTKNTIRDEIIAWFERHDPDGRIISSKLITRSAATPIESFPTETSHSKSQSTRKSLLIRTGTMTKFGRQYQKTPSLDTISSLEHAISASKWRGYTSKVSGEIDLTPIPDIASEKVRDKGENKEKSDNKVDEDEDEENQESNGEVLETKEFHYSHLLPLLSDILPVHIEDNLITASLSLTDRRSYCEALVMYIFEIALERSKTILIVENIHWCDCGSLTYLLHWLQKKNGCFFLCTTRYIGERSEFNSSSSAAFSPASAAAAAASAASASSLSFHSLNPNHGRNEISSNRKKSIRGGGGVGIETRFHDIDAAHVIHEIYQQCSSTALHFFYKEEIIKLLETILGPTLLSQYSFVLNNENIEKIRKHTDGSPILTHMIAVELEDALRRGTFKSIDDLPSGTDALILSRFDKLTTRDQIILKVASVLGQTFTTTELHSVLYRLGDINSSTGLTEALTSLVNSNLIQPVAVQRRQIFSELPSSSDEMIGGGAGGGGGGSGGGVGGEGIETIGTYSFVNRSIQDGIYYLMLETQRKQTHSVIGNLLEEQLEMTGFKPVLFLAVTNHYMRSDNQKKKYEFLVRSAQLAKATNDNYTANSHYDELIHMKTDRGVGDLLASCTEKSSSTSSSSSSMTTNTNTAGGGGSGGGGAMTSSKPARGFKSLFSQQYHSIGSHGTKKSVLRRQESMTNIFAIDGFGSDRKWIQVRELKSRFQTREVFSEKTICMWIGEVARARFNLGDFRAAHNLFMLALYNAYLPLSKIDLESCHWLTRDVSTSFHTSTDLWTYLAHSKLALTNVSPSIAADITAIEICFAQYYLYLALISFLYGSIEGTIYLLENSRQLLHALSPHYHNKELTATELKVLTLLAVAFYYRGKIHKSQHLLHLIHQKSHDSSDHEHISTRLLGVAMIETFSALFKDSRIKFRKVIELLELSNEKLLKHLVSLHLAWSLFLSGRLVESQTTLEGVMSYAMSTDHTTLLVWSYQLDMLIRIFAGEFSIVEVIAQKVRNIRRKDTLSASTSAVLGLALLLQRKFDLALPCLRYACQKLSKSKQISLQGYVMLFCSLFSALCLLKIQQVLSNEASTMECLALIIRNGIQRLFLASKTHGILKLFMRTLECLCHCCPRYFEHLHVPTVVEEHNNNGGDEDLNLSFEYREFIFGRAFLSLVLSLNTEESNESSTDANSKETEKLFSKLCSTNSKKMLMCCRTLLFSQTSLRSEYFESLFVPRQGSLASGVMQNLSSESSAIPTLLSHSPRKKLTGLDLINGSVPGSGGPGGEQSPPNSQVTSYREPYGGGGGVGSVGNNNPLGGGNTSVGFDQFPYQNTQQTQQHHTLQQQSSNTIVDEYVPIRILVVDDAPTALKITSRMLTKIGCEVTVGTNGLEAVKIIQELTQASQPWFHAILLDLQMPVMDGVEACQMIRSLETKLIKSTHNSTYHTKQIIVAVSINADDTTKEETIKAGFDYFLPKPYRIDEFETILKLNGLKLEN